MKPSYTAVGVIGLVLGGLWYATGGTKPPAPAAEPVRVAAPVSHDNLTVYLVHGPDTVDDSRVVTLQEALERKLAVVHETGSVNELAVENLSPDHELFVQSGDIIKGGRQDRMIATDLLVPPAAGRVAVPAHCVEAGRWTGRPNEAAGSFAVSDSFAVGNDIKLANIARDQSGVWAKVKDNQDKLSRQVGTTVNAAASPTSLQLALENPAVRAKADAYRSALAAAGEARGVVGVVFVVNGKVTGAEVYGSHGLFRRAWPKLLKAASEEALAEKADGRTPAPPSAREVERFLASAGKPESAAAGDVVPEEVILDLAANPNDALVAGGQVGNNVFRGRTGATRTRLLSSGGGNAFSSLSNNEFNQWDVGLRMDVPRGQAVQTAGRPLANQTEGRRSGVDRPFRSGGMAGVAFQQPDRPGPTADVIVEVRDLLEPAPNRAAAPHNPGGNRLNSNRVENRSALVVESKDSARNAVIRKSYIKK